MGMIQGVREKISFQDTATIAGLGALGGAITSRFVHVISPTGGILAGAIYGSAIYLGQLLAGEELTPTRSMIATALSIMVAGFVLFKGGNALATRFGYEVIPTSGKGISAIGITNLIGNSFIIYFPVIFPSLRTAPTLPDKFEDICTMPPRKVHACHHYYEGNPQVFSGLSSEKRFGLNQSFKNANLSTFSSTAYDFKSWDKETVAFVRDNDYQFETPEDQTSYQIQCYNLSLDPPKMIAEGFPLLTTVAEVLRLDDKQKPWYKKLFETYPSKWEKLSPAVQMAFQDLDVAFTGEVRLPKTIEEVNALTPAGVDLFHTRFSSDTYESEPVLLAMIGRFAKQGQTLPKGYEEKLEKLPQLSEGSEVDKLDNMSVHLYSIKYTRDPSQWNALPKKVQWAFIAKGYVWPTAKLPSPVDILAMPPERLRYYHASERFRLFTDPEACYLLCSKFFENDIPPHPDMIAAAISYIQTKEERFSPFKDLQLATDVDNLHPNQLQWFAGLFRDHRISWTKLNLNVQVAFKKKSDFEFLHYTYPTEPSQIDTLTSPTIQAFQEAFDINVMNSTGPNPVVGFFRKKAHAYTPLDDQKPELFTLNDGAREAILKALGTKFDPETMPKALDHYISPPTTAEIIRGLSEKALDFWGRYYTRYPEEWEKLALMLQVAFRKRKRAKNVDFPLLCLIAKDENLRTLAAEGSRKHALPTDLADNPELQALLFIADDVFYSNKDQGEFNLYPWVGLSLTTQNVLLLAFRDANIAHYIPGTGRASDVPAHPLNNGVVPALNADLKTAYYTHFNPAVFSLGADGNLNPNFAALLDEFRADFAAKLPDRLSPTIKKDLESTNELSDPDRIWARKVFTDEHGGAAANYGKAAWDSLSLGAQLIHKEACSAVDGGLPADYVPRVATLENIKTLNEEQLGLLHTYYQNHQDLWIPLEDPVRIALNISFKKIGKNAFGQPWEMTTQKANGLVNPALTAYAAYYDMHDSAWSCLDHSTQNIIKTNHPALRQNPNPNQGWKAVQWNRFRYGYNPTINLKNAGYTTGVVTAVATEYFTGAFFTRTVLSLAGKLICILPIPYVCS